MKLIHGNCLEVMKSIENNSIDMILCDLPYGRTQNKLDVIIPFVDLWDAYKKVIKSNGCIALFADGLFMADLMNSNRKMWKYNLVWDKVLVSGFLNANWMPLRQHEEICIFYNKQPAYNPQFTQGNPLHGKGTSYMEKELTNNNYGKFGIVDDRRKGAIEKYPTSIIKFSKPHPSVVKHPTEKSVELCEWLIKTYTNEGDLVLDNCMGSGTTGVACKNLKREFIGIELNEKYFEIAKQRICDYNSHSQN